MYIILMMIGLFGMIVKKNLIKVLIGQRRVGKSYLLDQIENYLISQKLFSQNTLFLIFLLVIVSLRLINNF